MIDCFKDVKRNIFNQLARECVRTRVNVVARVHVCLCTDLVCACYLNASVVSVEL